MSHSADKPGGDNMSEYVTLKREKIITSDYTQLNIRQKYKDTISIVLHTVLNSYQKDHPLWLLCETDNKGRKRCGYSYNNRRETIIRFSQ